MEKLKNLLNDRRVIDLVVDYLGTKALAKVLKDEFYNVLTHDIWQKYKHHFPVKTEDKNIIDSDGYLKTSELVWMSDQYGATAATYRFEQESTDAVVEKYGDDYADGKCPHLVIHHHSINIRRQIIDLIFDELRIKKQITSVLYEDEMFELFVSFVVQQHDCTFSVNNIIEKFLGVQLCH